MIVAQCNYCGEEIDSLAYQCNSCGRDYCNDHRIPEKHNCVGLSKSTKLGPDFHGLRSGAGRDREQTKADSDRSGTTAESESAPSGQAGKRHRDWEPSSKSPEVVVDRSETTGGSDSDSGHKNELALGFRLKRVFNRLRRSFWRHVPSVRLLVVLAVVGVVALLSISSIGGIGVGPVDDASDRTSEILGESVGAVNETIQESSSDESGSAGPSNEDFERAIHTEVNDVRARNGLNALEYSAGLGGVARDHSRDMDARDYFDHDSPEGWTPQDRVDASDDVQCRVGENIYTESGFSHSDAERVAERVVDSWMDSPGHRANILFEEWSTEGIGVHIDGRDLWVTQKFC